MTETSAKMKLDDIENYVFNEDPLILKTRIDKDCLMFEVDTTKPLVCVTELDIETITVATMSFNYITRSTARFESVPIADIGEYIINCFN